MYQFLWVKIRANKKSAQAICKEDAANSGHAFFQSKKLPMFKPKLLRMTTNEVMTIKIDVLISGFFASETPLVRDT